MDTKTRLVHAICSRIAAVVAADRGTANREVLQQLVARMRAMLRRHRLWEAEELAYHILMEYEGASPRGLTHEIAKN